MKKKETFGSMQGRRAVGGGGEGGVGVKTQERLHSWSGVSTDHKGNVLTELPANPEEIKSKRRKKKSKL